MTNQELRASLVSTRDTSAVVAAFDKALPQRKPISKWLWGVLGFSALVATLAANSAGSDGHYHGADGASDPLGGRGFLIERAVRGNLRDPDSAQFSGMRSARLPNGEVAVCGIVNAKNGFGGYGGDELYFAKIRGYDVITLVLEEEGGAYTACKTAGLGR
ncbi:MAG: hypothetical protein ABSA66_08370 [Roseiarcus sp.]|jgi:hypothetical protein